MHYIKRSGFILLLSMLFVCNTALAKEQPKDPKAIEEQLAREMEYLKNLQFPSEIPKKNAPIISPENLGEEQMLHGYIARIYRDKNSEDRGAFCLLKNDLLLFVQEGGIFSIGLVHDRIPDQTLVKMGDDVVKDGVADLVVSERSPGTPPNYSFYVFSLGRESKLIDKIGAGPDEWARFKDMDRDGELEFLFRDPTFNYWHANLSNSPKPKIVYKYRDGKYRFAFDVMQKRPPDEDDLAKEVEKIQARIKEIEKETKEKGVVHQIDELYYSAWIKEDTIIPSSVWAQMLELIYSGNSDVAWKFLELAWPAGKPGKQEFLIEFKTQLSKSKYWQEIVKATAN